MWRFAGERKHFIDPRYFPFKAWYSQYSTSFIQVDNERTSAFINKLPANVWIISLSNRPLTQWFNKSPNWRLAFYSTSAAVFIDKNVRLPDNTPRSGKQLDAFRNTRQAQRALQFALSINDRASAQRIINSMAAIASNTKEQQHVNDWKLLFQGQAAFIQGDYPQAARFLEQAWVNKRIYNRDLLIRALFETLGLTWQQRNYQQAMDLNERILKVSPNQAFALFNRGMLQWFLQGPQSTEFNNTLTTFLEKNADNKTIPTVALEQAKRIIANPTIQEKPLILKAGPVKPNKAK